MNLEIKHVIFNYILWWQEKHIFGSMTVYTYLQIFKNNENLITDLLKSLYLKNYSNWKFLSPSPPLVLEDSGVKPSVYLPHVSHMKFGLHSVGAKYSVNTMFVFPKKFWSLFRLFEAHWILKNQIILCVCFIDCKKL